MQFWVVDESNGGGLSIIGTKGFAPQVHYGPPPVLNGEPVTDPALLRKMRGYVSPATGNIIELDANDEPPAFWFDSEANPPQWRNSVEDLVPENIDPIVPATLFRAVLKPGASGLKASSELLAAKAAKKAEVERRYALEAYSPFQCSNGKTYQISPELERGLSVVNAGKESIEWTAADNTRQSFTAQEFKDLCKAIFDRGQAKFLVRRAKKDEIDALTTLQEVEDYDVTTGW
jgi:hypothetical protein